MIQNHLNDIGKGLVGSGASLLGVIASLSDLEAHLRITSLLIGICVGLLTAISIIKKWNK